MKKTTKRLNHLFIKKTLELNKEQIRKYSVKKIGLFGSYRKGTFTPKSDIDILVKLKKPTFDNYMDLKFYLEKLFGKKIDLITEESVKPALRHIKEEALYAKGI